MVNQDNFFDLWDIFANELIGDVWLFIILGLILIWFLSIKFKMPYQLSVLFGMLWLVIIFAETQIYIIWVFVVLYIGTSFYFMYSRGLRRG